MKVVALITAVAVLILAGPARSSQRLVPDQYSTIQDAIDASRDGDVVVLAPDTYTGPGNRDLNFGGKEITVRSTDPADPEIVDATVIDCEEKARAFTFDAGEGPNSVVAGLTITNGRRNVGGGIYCQFASSPTIDACVIADCAASMGGAVACGEGSDPNITNCIMTRNTASVGAAVYSNAGSPTVFNCLMTKNEANGGATLYFTGGISEVANCTLAANSSGIHCANKAAVAVTDSILWSNMPGPELEVAKSGAESTMTVANCLIQNGTLGTVVEAGCTLDWDEGNLDADPKFEEGPLGDYYLAKSSPAVNAGSDSAKKLLLDFLTTSTDGTPDADAVDLGFHYAPPKKP